MGDVHLSSLDGQYAQWSQKLKEQSCLVEARPLRPARCNFLVYVRCNSNLCKFLTVSIILKTAHIPKETRCTFLIYVRCNSNLCKFMTVPIILKTSHTPKEIGTKQMHQGLQSHPIIHEGSGYDIFKFGKLRDTRWYPWTSHNPHKRCYTLDWLKWLNCVQKYLSFFLILYPS